MVRMVVRVLIPAMVLAVILMYVFSLTGTPNIHYLITGGVLVVLAITDHQLTRKGLKLGAQEANPLVRWFIRKLGFNATLPIVLVFLALLIAFRWESLHIAGQLALIIIWGIVVANNVRILRHRMAIARATAAVQ